jgi:hypothetical protein
LSGKEARVTRIPSAAAYALVQDLRSIQADEREAVCQEALALLAEEERLDGESMMLIEYGFGDQVSPEDRARLRGDDGDESTE